VPDELVAKFEATILLCSGEVQAECGERLRALWQAVGPSPG
jgi:hypothetical protein